jgi:hypothetical protein
MRSPALATRVFAAVGALLLLAAVILSLLGSFSYLAAAAVGLVFIAAALISHAARSTPARAPAILALFGVFVALFGTTGTPFLYVGLVVVALAAAAGLLVLVRGGSART